MPNRTTHPKLVEAWLDFHREWLCRDIDAVFAFDGQGMEIWCRSGEKNDSYQKLLKIIQPLLNSHMVELYSTLRSGRGSGTSELSRSDIPPSLFENRELRAGMRPVPASRPPRIVRVVDSEGNVEVIVLPSPPEPISAREAASDRALRSNLASWANSVMKHRRIMRQYAEDIPELINVAAESIFDEVLRRSAMDICLKHVKELGKSIRDLNKKISYAFPKNSVKAVENKAGKKETKKKIIPAALPAVIVQAEAIAAAARGLYEQIYRFIFPADHTVDIDDLQMPGLLVSLNAIETDTRDFEQALTNLPYFKTLTEKQQRK